MPNTLDLPLRGLLRSYLRLRRRESDHTSVAFEAAHAMIASTGGAPTSSYTS